MFLFQPGEAIHGGIPLSQQASNESRLSMSESVSEFFDAQEVLLSASSSENEVRRGAGRAGSLSLVAAADAVTRGSVLPRLAGFRREGRGDWQIAWDRQWRWKRPGLNCFTVGPVWALLPLSVSLCACDPHSLAPVPCSKDVT